MQEVLLYPHVSTKRARTMTVFLRVISSGTITVVLAHQQALGKGLLKPEAMKGVRNVVQHPRREMWGPSCTEAIMTLFVKAL